MIIIRHEKINLCTESPQNSRAAKYKGFTVGADVLEINDFTYSPVERIKQLINGWR